MAKFLATNGVSYLLEGILIDAKTTLTIVSPSINITDELWERLAKSNEKQVKIRLVFSDLSISQKQKKEMAEWDHIELYEMPNIGSKCYFNENLLVVTSMNIFEYANTEKRDMGILVDAEEDKTLYRQAQLEVASIINAAKPYQLGDENDKLVMAS